MFGIETKTGVQNKLANKKSATYMGFLPSFN
jgi:hypothetical protein